MEIFLEGLALVWFGALVYALLSFDLWFIGRLFWMGLLQIAASICFGLDLLLLAIVLQLITISEAVVTIVSIRLIKRLSA